MSTLVYASSSDYQTWTGATPPANITPLLRTASFAVREATMTAYYAVDTTGLPTDATILQAFKDATCAQASALATAGIDPLAGGVMKASTASQKAVGSARIDYADAAAAAASRADLLDSLCLEATRILQQAGVLTSATWVVG